MQLIKLHPQKTNYIKTQHGENKDKSVIACFMDQERYPTMQSATAPRKLLV